MSDSPYVTFYTSDFLAGTSGMTAATKGVYITLLCLMYETESPLSQKWDTLARRCGCTLPAFKRAIQDLCEDGKMDVVGAGLWSRTCDKHIAQRRERRSSAKAAAEKRWEKSEEKQRKRNAPAMREECQPEPEPYKRDTNVSLDARARDVLCQICSFEASEDFVAHRREMRKPLTERAARAIVKKLQGHPDPSACLNDSVGNGWQGVFPEKTRQRGKPSGNDIANQVAARFGEMDFGQGSDSVVPFLPAGHTR